MFLLLNSCDHNQPEHSVPSDLIDYFNAPGRYDRFENSTLMYGEELSIEAERILFTRSEEEHSHTARYRKAAHVFFEERDTFIYFMYGIAAAESILSEFRIRSFRNDTLVEDQLLLAYSANNSLFRDYQFMDNVMSLYAKNDAGEKHFTNFIFQSGYVYEQPSEQAILPDTVFRKSYFPKVGQQVRFFDDFSTKTVESDAGRVSLSGRMVKIFGGGKSCANYMLVELDDGDAIGFPFVQTSWVVNGISELHGLMSDSIIANHRRCFETSYWPVATPVLIADRVFVETAATE